jgi:hypothetical protein
MTVRSKSRRGGALALALALACTPRAERADVRPAAIDVRPAPSGSALVAAPPSPRCVLEGDGEPEDRLMFHKEEDLVVFGARGDVDPLVRIEGRGRYTLHGRWTELSAEDGDGRARLTLESPGTVRITGFSLLHATRFRLRRRSVVVEGHVWLEPDFVVRVAGVRGGRARVVAAVPLDAPRELSLEVGCSDLAYDDRRERVSDPPKDEEVAHVGQLALYDAPGGRLAFEGGSSLFFVAVDEEREGFARIRGERYGIRIAGWTPLALVSHAPQGSGSPGGSRSSQGHGSKGRAARITRTTLLLAERAGARTPIGELAPGAEVRVVRSGPTGTVAVELATVDVRPADGVALLVDEAAVELR